ncbi:MAG TPA: type II toxin-antitoxin system VapC family toxin [Vicinamibacteria bacterium]
MVFVDSNVPMYLVGLPHPNRDRLEAYLRSHAEERYVTSAEVYQEVIHRYVAIDRRLAIGDCFAFLDALAQQVYPITKEETEKARTIALAQRRLSGRDCLHIATMERYGITRILSFDRDFELWSGITCLPI